MAARIGRAERPNHVWAYDFIEDRTRTAVAGLNCRELVGRTREARQVNGALQRSTSWRITAPLRAIGRSIAVGRRLLNDSVRPDLRYSRVARSDTPFQPRLFSKSVP